MILMFVYSITCFIIIELTNGPPPIRLIDGETSHDGRVEIYIQVYTCTYRCTCIGMCTYTCTVYNYTYNYVAHGNTSHQSTDNTNIHYD